MNNEQRVRLWDWINQYTITCGGDPSRHVYGNTSRMKAVAEIERVIREIEQDEPKREPPPFGHVSRANECQVEYADVCGKLCDHGSECLELTGHTGGHETQHGCVFYDDEPKREPGDRVCDGCGVSESEHAQYCGEPSYERQVDDDGRTAPDRCGGWVARAEYEKREPSGGAT